jgi:hypothetical protein
MHEVEIAARDLLKAGTWETGPRGTPVFTYDPRGDGGDGEGHIHTLALALREWAKPGRDLAAELRELMAAGLSFSTAIREFSAH